MIAIIDYDAGNLKSVEKALVSLGESPVISRDREILLSADKVILPGVGAFGEAMDKLHQYGLVEVIQKVAAKGTPLLGICLGLQLFFESSQESEGVKGLGLLPGKILRFPETLGLKVPHMGWNCLDIKPEAKLFKGIKSGEYVYFVHSYYLEAERQSDVAATAEYGLTFGASVERGNVFACQFHPEKSSDTGLKILKNFIELT
jgi:glutamine amidotransferase